MQTLSAKNSKGPITWDEAILNLPEKNPFSWLTSFSVVTLVITADTNYKVANILVLLFFFRGLVRAPFFRVCSKPAQFLPFTGLPCLLFAAKITSTLLPSYFRR